MFKWKLYEVQHRAQCTQCTAGPRKPEDQHSTSPLLPTVDCVIQFQGVHVRYYHHKLRYLLMLDSVDHTPLYNVRCVMAHDDGPR